MDSTVKLSAALGALLVIRLVLLPTFAAASNAYPVYGTKRYHRSSAPDRIAAVDRAAPVAVARFDDDESDPGGPLEAYEPYDRESEYYGQPTYAGEYNPKPFYYAQGPSYSLYDDAGNARSGQQRRRPASNPLDDLHEQMQQENAARREREMRQRIAAATAAAGDGRTLYDDDVSNEDDTERRMANNDPETSRAFFHNLMAYNNAMSQQRANAVAAAAAAAAQYETQEESYNPELMGTYGSEYAPVRPQQFDKHPADKYYAVESDAGVVNAMNSRHQQQQEVPVELVDQDVKALQSLAKSSIATPNPKLAGNRNKGRQNNKAKNGEKGGKKGNKNKNQKQQKQPVVNDEMRPKPQQSRQSGTGKTQQQQQKQTNKQRKKEQRRLQREQERRRVQQQQQEQEAAALLAEQLADDEQRIRYEQLAKYQAEERRQQQELEREQLLREQHWIEQQQQQQQQQQPTRSQQRQQKQQQQQKATGSMLRTGEPTPYDGTYYTDPEYDDTWTNWDRKRNVNAAASPMLVPYDPMDYETAVGDMDIDQLLQETIGAVYDSEPLVIRPKALNHEQPQRESTTPADLSMTATTPSPPQQLIVQQQSAPNLSGQKEVMLPRPATPVRHPFAAPIMQLLAAQQIASTPSAAGEENVQPTAQQPANGSNGMEVAKDGNGAEVYKTIRQLMRMEQDLTEKTNKVKREYISNEESLVHELRNLKQAQSSA